MINMRNVPSLFELTDADHPSVDRGAKHPPTVPADTPAPRKPSRAKPHPHFEAPALFPLENSADSSQTARSPSLKRVAKAPLPEGFSHSHSKSTESPEYYRVRRKVPYPAIMDDLLIRIVSLLPLDAPGEILCEGPVFPSLVAACSQKANRITYVQEDREARQAARKLASRNCPISTTTARRGVSKFVLVVSCVDDFAGKVLVEKILSMSDLLSPLGFLLVAVPSEFLLDYTTNVRNEAPLMRDALHRKYKTHFILRPTGPLMQPAWDILLLTPRPPSSHPTKSKWRVTGTGFLPWQKCNEAISSSPWLLVESPEQVPPAVARCLSYPWEAFPSIP